MMILIMKLQQSVTAPNHFFPDTLIGWLQVVSIVGGAGITAAGILLGSVRKSVNKTITSKVEAECKDRKAADTNIEQRITTLASQREEKHIAIATDVHTIMGKVEIFDRFAQGSEMDRRDLRSQVAEVRGETRSLKEAFHEAEIQRATEMGEIKVMMARIEGKLDARLQEGVMGRRKGDTT